MPTNAAILSSLNSQVLPRWVKLEKDIKAMGWTVVYTSGYRTWVEQAALRAQLGKGAALPGYSSHNYGIATDFNLYNPKTGQWLKKATPKATWEATGIPKLIRASGFRWGGDFNGNYDPVHIDLINEFPIDQLRALALQTFGDKVDQIKANLLNLLGNGAGGPSGATILIGLLVVGIIIKNL